MSENVDAVTEQPQYVIDALAHLEAATIRLDLARAADGEFRTTSKVPDAEHQRRQIEIDVELKAAGDAFQSALQTWGQYQGGK